MVLLYLAYMLVHLMWKKKKDPDNAAIPYLTALGDLLGSVFLGLTFVILSIFGMQYGNNVLWIGTVHLQVLQEEEVMDLRT